MFYVAAALLISFLAGINPAHAVFQQIWAGYQTSTVNELRMVETSSAKNALDVSLSENAWSFELKGAYDDTFLDALFAFNAQRTISESYSLKLSKDTFNYGSFSYELLQGRYDLSFWTATGFSTTSVDKLYETRNSFTYTYDLIGRSQPLRKEIAQAQFGADSAQNELEQEQEYLDFYQAYLAAKLQVFRSRLADEFKSRAARLRGAIYKRYKDGLSREAEYLQAENSELAQEQEVEKSLAALKESVAVIENILGKEIPQKYFEQLSWSIQDNSGLELNQSADIVESNKRMRALEARIQLVDKNLEQFEDRRGHTLKLNASYTTNAFNEDIDNSFYQGDIITPNNDAKSVALVYTVPLGMDYDQAEREKLFIDKKRSELQKRQLKDELELRSKVFATKIERYKKAYGIGRRQVEIASKRVKEQSKLYLRGLGTFDETIRAEQELLNAKSALYQTLYDYDMTLGNFAFLGGKLSLLLNSYND